MLSLSTRDRRQACVPSRAVSARPCKLRQENPTRSSFFLLVFAFLTAPSLWSIFHGFHLWAGRDGRGSGFGIGRIGVRAAECSQDAPRYENVSNENFISTMFACENGEFIVSWEGNVNISETIYIGHGTIVRIFGESSMPSRDGTESSDSSISPSSSVRNSDSSDSSDSSNGSSTDVNLDVEVERLSRDLNLPQKLTSAAVGLVVLGSSSDSGEPFGPIFFVDGGELHLESLAIRKGYTINSTSNGTEGSGGGIYAYNSNVSVSGCEFEENFASYVGGGIYANVSTLTITNTVFRGNRAGYNSSAGDENAKSAGGGIACEHSNLFINGCLFDDNYANNKGGGVHIGVGRVSVVDSLFFNNFAGSKNVESDDPLGEGAAISFTECTYSFNSHSSCGVNDTTFIYNAAGKKGAAVAVGSGDAPSHIEFYRCVVDNSSTGWPFEDDPQGEGGAFALGDGTTLVLEDCLVTNNYAGKKGGAITLSSGDDWDDPGATVIVRNSNFSGNIADVEAAGVINLGKYATVRIEGQGNNFTENICGTGGGVLSATIDTRVVVEGGIFKGNDADEAGGVFFVGGVLNITGGTFSENKATDNGGILRADEESTVYLFDGLFEGNEANDGGVVSVSEDGNLFVLGGIYSGNKADNGGGVFWGDDGGNLEIKGGTFTGNSADFGGFIYVEGAGTTSCEGGSVEKHRGVDGGAVYAVEDAVVDWACHLIDNEALSGPAIYARDSAYVTVRGVNVSDNEIARGSVIFVVSSILHTYQVNIRDSSGNSDLSAVQSDSDSVFIAEETAFVGFKGETVVYSEGDLVLDDCDFSQSFSSTLVYSGSSTTPVIRNAVLGDNNFEDAIQKASTTSVLPVNASLINVALTCNASGSPCSTGSICLEGDVGVYCQCYVRSSFEGQAGLETCLDGDPGGLSLTNKTDPLTTFYPNLLEGDIVLALDADAGDGPASTLTASSTFTPSLDSTSSTITSVLTSGGVIWNVSATPNDFISWTILPSVGLLLPGKNISVRLASLPSADFDGTDTAEFIAHALGAPDQLEEHPSSSSLSNLSSSKLLQTDEDIGDGRLEQEMKVTYYHCNSGNFWNYTGGNETMDCELCTNIEGGAEALDCSEAGASTLNLPLRSGYWRATLDTTVVRECFNEGACIGGIATTTTDDYCETGNEGPFCGVCSSGYGRGSANVCHECTEEFKGVMYFLLVVAFVLVVVAIVLLGIYLVGGGVAVSQTVYTTRESVRMLHRRSSSLFIRSEVSKSRDTTNMERRASGRAFSKTASSHVRTISGDSVAVSNPSSNAKAPIPSLSLAATYAVHAGQVTATRGRSADIRNDGYIDDAKVADPAAAADTGTSGQALLSSYTRVQHSSSNFTIEPSPAPTLAASASTLPPAPALVPGSTSAQEEAEDKDKEKDKPAAVIIGEFLGRLPLSKIKIVIVVWQISSAFAAITEIPFPEVYERFLAVIGIFSFDLGWILSAACVTIGLDFYDELLIVTIGPVFLLGLLGITFYLGSRPSKLPSRRGVSPRIRNRNINRDAVGVSSSGATVLGSTDAGSKIPEQDASTNTITNIDGNIATNSGMTSILPVDTSVLDKDDGDHAPSSRERTLTRGRSVRRIWKDGPGDNANSEQAHLWNLFARHTTMTLIILYLIYSTVSTVVFQTFACESLDDIGKSFLRADFRIECYTPKYEAFRIYAAIMVCIYPLGIPLAFWYFLARHKTRINPSIDENSKCPRWEHLIVEKKCEKRKDDSTVAPTSFLWSAYYPDRYYFEVCECIRRLLLTGVLVFIPDTPKQVAYSCLFAFISLVAFELLRPHMDQLDRVLYRTGCLVIFFTNFLAMIITADVTQPESDDLAAYAIVLIVVNIVLAILSITWNTWAATKAMLSARHMQGMTIGLDLVGEGRMDAVVAAIKAKETKGRGDVEEEVKREIKDLEAAPAGEGDPSVAEEPTEINRISSRRFYDETDRRDNTNNPAREFVLLTPSSMAPRAADASGDNRSTPEPCRRQYPLRRNDAMFRTWAPSSQCPSSTTPVADSIFDRGPRSRGFPYSSRILPATSSSQNSSQAGIHDLNN